MKKLFYKREIGFVLKKYRFIGIGLLFFISLNFVYANEKIGKDCVFKGKMLQGNIKIVDSFPDFKVKIVNSFPDLKVKKVKSFPDSCGKWKFVDSFPDFTVKFVDSFPDFTIKYVDSFPGVD